IYILLPAVMIVGLLLIPIGMLIQMRKIRKMKEHPAEEWPRIDLNLTTHRNAFFIFTGGTTLLLFLTAVGSYEAFHFTESVVFCGQLCHKVMHPEFTAYQNSPHARVACVECHVGSGASWYVRSKLSGLYQVYATIRNIYPQPIPTPIRNLRPARETCEQCHWPQKFYARQLRVESHFIPDEDNTQWDIHLIMKIGAEKSALGLREGIHWHINPNVKIEYIAADEEREQLPWVRYTNLETGEVIVYQDEENPLEKEQIQEGEIRTMDCMDCHNRPSHDYRPPTVFINMALTAGDIPKELPYIKNVAVELCGEEYPSSDSAMKAIEAGIRSYYEDEYPEIVENQPELIEQAIKGVQEAFSKNIFPDMKVRWDKYPNHIGHMNFNGCFRCHNDTHASESGAVIRKDCNLCHVISAQGTPGEMQYASAGDFLEFKHPDPDDEGEDWKDGFCTDCHEGLNP
ncbi:MAG: cytochrome C, partial [Methanobacteriota archaeon]